MIRFLAGLAALAMLTTAGCAKAAAPEQPQAAAPITRIVAFGDSFADDGNIFELFGTTPPPLYPRGRFSDGTNFVDTMGELLRVPVANFALGGAVTGPGSNNNPAGLDQQYRAFLAGGGPAYFPRVSGRFSPGDLVVVSIGGNDARAYAKSFGRAPSPARGRAAVARAPAAAAISVAQATAALDALVGAGARRITFLGGDVGRLPEFAGGPAAPVGSAFSKSYNDGMKASLARFAARGVSVRYLDLDQLANRVEADPAAFGLASAGACPARCASDPALARKYLFYVDKVHLTSAGFAIVGREAVAQLRAGR